MPTGSRTPIDCYISHALKLAQGAAYSPRPVAKGASLVWQNRSLDRPWLFGGLRQTQVYARVGTFHVALGKPRRGEAVALVEAVGVFGTEQPAA